MKSRLPLIALSAGLFLSSGITLPARAADPADTSKTQTDPQPPRPEPSRWLTRMRSALDGLQLSDDQKQKVDGFFSDAEKGLKQAKDEAGDDRRELMQKSREVFSHLREQVSSVLSDDQKQALRDKLFNQLPAEMMNRLKASLEKLGLSDEQKQKVNDILADTQKQLEDLHKSADQTASETRTKVRDLLRSTREKIQSVLTDEQKQKLEESRPQRGNPNE